MYTQSIQSIKNHPIQNFLLDSIDQLHEQCEREDLQSMRANAHGYTSLEVNDRAVVMSSEVARAVPLPVPPVTRGTIRSRLYSIADDSTGCETQGAWREKAKSHPAYLPIYQELREAYEAGQLPQMFDRLEGMGFEVYYDREATLMTIGLNLAKLRAGFKEVTEVRDLRNKKALDVVNNVRHSVIDTLHVADTEIVVEPFNPSYYLTFDLSGTL